MFCLLACFFYVLCVVAFEYTIVIIHYIYSENSAASCSSDSRPRRRYRPSWEASPSKPPVWTYKTAVCSLPPSNVQTPGSSSPSVVVVVVDDDAAGQHRSRSTLFVVVVLVFS